MKKTVWNFLWTGVLLPLVKEHGPEFIDWLFWKVKGSKPGVIELSKELQDKIATTDGLTKKEKCLQDHAGQCGQCDEQGNFTAC